MDLIKHAIEQRNEDLLMKRWILHYQDQVSFEDFKRELGIGVIDDDRTETEILSMVESILG